MNHKRPPIPVIIIIVLAVAFSAYFLVTQSLGAKNGALTASGTIEAVQVNLAPELAGKVAEVLVEEGQVIQAGDPLLRLDPRLLDAQRQVALSGLESARSALLTAQSAHALAQAQYNATLLAARAQEGAERLADWKYQEPSEFGQPLWYFTRAEQIAAAQAELDAAVGSLELAQASLDEVVQNLNNADFVAAETRLAQARIGYLVAELVHRHAQLTGGDVNPEDVDVDLPPYVPAYRVKIAIAKALSGESDILTASQEALDAARAELDEAQQAYTDLLDTDAADAVHVARADLSVARERYEVALDMLTRLQTGESSPQVKIAAAALEQAQNVLLQADSAVRQAEANLALLDTQFDKLTVTAPMDGVVLTRNVQPGEFVQPGTTAFVIGELGNLTITVFIPEDRYGQLSVGRQAEVTVDSFPGVVFTATVIQISDKAEFTPRNVQTVEGRSSTVYAVKLSVSDPEGRLKIGMPADVVFP